MIMILKTTTLILGVWLISLTTLSLAEHDAKDISCFVCSNSKDYGNPLYKKNCFDMTKMSKVDKDAITVKCSEYPTYVKNLLDNAGTKRSSGLARNIAMKDEDPIDETCPAGSYNACRSYYYEYSGQIEVKLTNHSKDNPITGPFKGDTERVFRFCGCATKEEETLKQPKCHEIRKAVVRKRYCVCSPDKPDLPCNSASPVKFSLLMFVLLLSIIMFFQSF